MTSLPPVSDHASARVVHRPRPVIRPFTKLDRVDKAAEIHRRTRMGQTVTKIAEAVGVTPGAIYDIARVEGISTISAQQRLWPGKDDPGIVNFDPSDPFTLPAALRARHHWKRLTKAAREQRKAIGAAPPAPKPRPRVEVVINGTPRPVTPFHTEADQIIAQVADQHDLTVPEIKSRRRDVIVVAARHHAIYRLGKETTMSLKMIGRKFGGMDHTSVLHAMKKHQERINGAPARKERREPVWGVGGWK